MQLCRSCERWTFANLSFCYWHAKARVDWTARPPSPNGLSDGEREFVGFYGTPEHEPGWRSAASLLGWLERDDAEPEARGITYSVSLDGTTWELSV